MNFRQQRQKNIPDKITKERTGWMSPFHSQKHEKELPQ
jgi:hypothetical protein